MQFLGFYWSKKTQWRMKDFEISILAAVCKFNPYSKLYLWRNHVNYCKMCEKHLWESNILCKSADQRIYLKNHSSTGVSLTHFPNGN